MNAYEKLIDEYSERLIVREKPLASSLGRIKGNRIAIKSNIPVIQRACVLAEEIGHYHTAVGNILDQGNTKNRKQELKGRAWAYDKLIGLNGIIEAYEAGCQSLYVMADYLNVAEDFLLEALQHYENKYGVCTKLDNYIICFIPCLSVLKLF